MGPILRDLGEREVEMVASHQLHSRRRRSSIEQMREKVKRASPSLSNRYKHLKTFKKDSRHLYFTNRTLTVRSLGSELQTHRSVRCAS